MSGFRSSNCTDIPNELIDKHMRNMSGPEFKVILAIFYLRGILNNPPSLHQIANQSGVSYNICYAAATSLENKGFIHAMPPCKSDPTGLYYDISFS